MSDFFVSKQDKGDLGFLRTAVNTGSGNTYAQWKIASSEYVLWSKMTYLRERFGG